MPNQSIERVRAGRGFAYLRGGQPIKDKDEIACLKALRIPPAWSEVKIAASRHARIQATGLDKAGRLQYIYHPAFRARQEKAKFERTLRFARALPHMRRITANDLKRPGMDRRKVVATIVRLMDRAYFRVGNDVYARENQSYGLTTLRSKHTKVEGNSILFDFIGKSGQRQIKKVTDARLARIVRRLDELPGYEIFKYYGDDKKLHPVSSADVNDYIKEVMGEEFSAKDFRTWAGTLLAAGELAGAERAANVRERKKVVTACVRRVARKLGNTPAIARSSYIDPRVIDAFVVSDELARVRRIVEKMENHGSLSRDEHCVLKLLERAKA